VDARGFRALDAAPAVAIVGTPAVTSVAGRTGAVVLNAADIGYRPAAPNLVSLSLELLRNDAVDLREYGAVDGQAADAAFAAAVSDVMTRGKALEIPQGLWPLVANNAKLLIPTNGEDLVIKAHPLARIERRWSGLGSGGLFDNADYTGALLNQNRPRRVLIEGGNWGTQFSAPDMSDLSATCTITGNLFAFIADDVTLRNVNCRGLGPNARFVFGGGRRWHIDGMRAWHGQKITTGSGGIRPVVCEDTYLVTNSIIICADDAGQAVPAVNGDFASIGLGYVTFQNCFLKSYKARAAAVLLNAAVITPGIPTISSSIRRADYINCWLVGGSRTVIIQNDSSSGQIEECNFINCDIDDSLNNEGTTPHAVVIQAVTMAGQPNGKAINKIRFKGCRWRRPQRDSIFCYGTEGALASIVVEDCEMERSRFDGTVACKFVVGDDILFRNNIVDVEGTLQDGVQYGAV
jgi:hypothetical protein